MDDNELYPIGDVARRTGLSVSAIRYYSDAGVIAPTCVTEAGYRLYDVRAIARLELIRTLRDLDAGLDDIRHLLDGQTSLHDLLATHLELVERQERDLRARRAVLRTLVKQGGTAAQVTLMHRLVSMSDEERERLVDDFWNEVGEDEALWRRWRHPGCSGGCCSPRTARPRNCTDWNSGLTKVRKSIAAANQS